MTNQESKWTKNLPSAVTDKKTVGRKGEQIACRALKKDGYRILEKNFRCRQGEIDIIAEEKGTICFVEVKSRFSENFGLPEEAVTGWKQRRLHTAAVVYLSQKGIKSRDVRFDIVSVDLKNEKARILKNAFEINF